MPPPTLLQLSYFFIAVVFWTGVSPPPNPRTNLQSGSKTLVDDMDLADRLLGEAEALCDNYSNQAWRQAKEKAHRALDLYKAAHRERDIVLASEQLGVIHSLLGEFDQAEKLLKPAFAYYQEHGSEQDKARIHKNLGRFYAFQEEYELEANI